MNNTIPSFPALGCYDADGIRYRNLPAAFRACKWATGLAWERSTRFSWGEAAFLVEIIFIY